MSTIDVEATLLEFLRQATVGEFEIVKELGRGGMAMVYLAKDLSLAREVAIKVMSPSLGADASMAERFVREAQTAASLSHPNIIPVYAVRQTASITFFVMKFIKGRPLDDIMEEVGQLPIDLASAILSQVAGALGYGHKRGIVHRDVKPGNVMIDDEGWAVVTDFGIAKVDQAEGLTQTGAAIGTPTYMSPEQCTAKPVTGASDQYSLGVVAYEMLTGRKPFDGDSVMSIMYAHVNEAPPPFRDERPDCPPELHDAVLKMLSKEAADRYQDLDDLVHALSSITAGPRGDHARTEMISLAQSGVSSKVIGKVRTPRSPAPLQSIQKSAVRSGVRPSAETVQTPLPSGDPVDSGSLINSGQVLATSKKKPLGLIAAAAAVVVIGGGGLVMAAPWQGAESTADADPGSAPETAPAAPTGPVVASLEISAPVTRVEELRDLELTATVLDSVGTPVDVPVEWETSDNSIATVDGGVVRTRRAGEVEISARAGTERASVTVTVSARPEDAPPPPTVTEVRVDRSRLELTVGERTTVRATVMGSDNLPMNVSPTWLTNRQSVATVSPRGTIDAVGVGDATITAERDNRTATVRVTVTAISVATVSVRLSPTTLDIGQTVDAVVDILAADNTVLDRAVTWRSTNPDVATVSGSGRSGTVSALTGGGATIIATVEGRADSVPITVNTAAPTGPTDAESRAAIVSLVSDFHAAFQASDIDAVARIYTGLDPTLRNNWAALFQDVQDFRVTYTPNPPEVIITDDRAEVRLTTQYRGRTSGGRLEVDFSTVLRFVLRESTWEMTEWQGGND